RHGIQNFAAPDRDHRRILANDKPVAGKGECRLLQTYLNKRGLARLKTVLPEQDDIAHQLGRSGVESNSLSCLNCIWRRAKQLQMAVEHGSRLEKTRSGQHHPALNV